jgi:uncharacterized protein (DUF1501 family)
MTAFTASDFIRIDNAKGTGSDPGWGSRGLIIGGAP